MEQDAGQSQANYSRRERLRKVVSEKMATARKQQLLKKIIALDRGNFRLESLAPWIDSERRLELWEKLLMTCLLITAALTVQTELVPKQTMAQHFSYLANFIAFASGSPIGYRTISILTSSTDLAHNDLTNGFVLQDDAIPDLYDTIFIIVNLYHLLRFFLNRFDLVRTVLNPIENDVYNQCFEPLGFTVYQYVKLIEKAEWCQQQTTQEVLMNAGEPVDALYVSVSGAFDLLSSEGIKIAALGPHQMIGEAAALEMFKSQGSLQQSARATVKAATNSVYLKWSHAALFDLYQRDDELAATIELAIARTLSHKLNSVQSSASKLGVVTHQTTQFQPMLAPHEASIYSTCLAPNGFTDVKLAFDFFRLASKQPLPQNSCSHLMLALAKGTGRTFQDGKCTEIHAPALIGAEHFLDTLLDLDRVHTSKAIKQIELEPGAVAFFWDLDTLSGAICEWPQLRIALTRLHLCTWSKARKNVDDEKAATMTGSIQASSVSSKNVIIAS